MDLKIRGRGEILGTQQSGFKTFKHFDPDQHEQLLSKAILYSKILDQEKQEGKVSPSVFLEIFQKNEVFKEI
jgi:RecG-like helicase